MKKTKKCSTCKKRKLASKFSRRAASPDGIHVVCKCCDNERSAKWKREHPEYNKEWLAAHPGYKEQLLKRDPLRYRRHHLEYAYGMSLEEFDAMFESQGKRCAVCRRKDFQPVVDHNHKTGRVRGILCYPCNSALGFLGDSIKKVKVALEYLKKHS